MVLAFSKFPPLMLAFFCIFIHNWARTGTGIILRQPMLWIRIRIHFGRLDPYPDLGGQKVLDVLF
jgi:hypothetical protein